MSDAERVLAALADGEQSVTDLAVSAGIPADRAISAVLSLYGDGRVRWQVDQGVKLWRLA